MAFSTSENEKQLGQLACQRHTGPLVLTTYLASYLDGVGPHPRTSQDFGDSIG